MKPVISIVIPSYNKASFIQQTLDSIKQQSFESWEAILVDDGSRDNSVSIIKKNCEEDTRIRLILREGEPSGGSACRNLGIKHAKGKFIMFLDADDLLDIRCFLIRLNKIKLNNQSDFWVFPVGTFYKKIGDSSSCWTPKGKGILYRFLEHDLPWNVMSVIWKKECLERLGGFDVDYPRLQDVELHTRALLAGDIQFSMFPDLPPTSYYRIDEDRIISSKEIFHRNWVEGVETYIAKMNSLIDLIGTDNIKRKKKLKGTIFSILATLLNRKMTAQLDDFFFLELKNQLLMNTEVRNLLNKRDIKLIQLYTKAYLKGFYRIKGFNFLFKKALTL